jgi:hypothetical protein
MLVRVVLAIAVAVSLMAQPPTPAPPKASVTFRGRVVESGSQSGIEGATVELSSGVGGGGGSVQTTADGSFAITTIPDRYVISVRRSGWTQGGPAMYVTLSDNTAPTTISLISLGSISGNVEDADGNPMEGIDVVAIRVPFEPLQGMVTDAEGKFHLRDLPAGNYVLRTVEKLKDAATDTRFAPTYYPSSLDVSGAAQILVNSGREIPGIRLTVQTSRSFSVTGDVVRGTSDPKAAYIVRLSRTDTVSERNEVQLQTGIAEDGSFRIDGVMPGSYQLTLREVRDNAFLLATEPVVITDRDWAGIRLFIKASGTFTGRVLLEDGTVSRAKTIAITSAGLFVNVPVSTDGTFSIDGLPMGTYRLVPPVVQKIEIDGRVFEGSRFEFAGAMTRPAAVTVSRTGATLAGSIERTPQGEEASGVILVLQQYAPGEPLGTPAIGPINKDGSFAVPGLEP